MTKAPIASAAQKITHVFVRNLEILAHIGVHGHEQGKLQPVRINVDLGVCEPEHLDDRLERVVDYEGFTATDWTRFLSLFRPRRPGGEERDPSRPRGGVIAVHEGGELSLFPTPSQQLMVGGTESQGTVVIERGMLAKIATHRGTQPPTV